jgi:uncharacterized protein
VRSQSRTSSEGTAISCIAIGLGTSSSPETTAKPKKNARRHKVRFEEAATAFADPLARIYDDPDHSLDEARFLLIGHSVAGRVLLVVHAEKGDIVRIISARRPTTRERARYEADA